MSDPDPLALLEAPFAEGALPPPEGPVAILAARPSPALRALGTRLIHAQTLRPLHDALIAEGRETVPRLAPEAGPFAAVLVVADRSREATRARLAEAVARAAPGAPVLLAGARTDGIDGHRRALRDVLAPAGIALEGLSRAHGRALWWRRPADPLPPPLAETLAAWRAAARPATGPEAFGRVFLTAPGAFSHGRADPGSLLLAEHLPPLSGRVADLAAGWGLLSAAVLRAPGVERLDLVEADLDALDLARANLAQEPRAAFHWADARAPGLPEGAFDAVVANPPFHASGRAADPGLGAAILAAAAPLLAPKGALWAVANRALPYERPLRAVFAELEEIGPPGPFKLLRARRPLARPRA